MNSVKKYKTLLLSLILILEVIVLVPFLGRNVTNTITEVFPELKGELKAEFGLRGIHTYGTNINGTKYQLDMKRASYYQVSQELSGDNFVGKFWDKKNREIQIDSKVAFYNLATQKIAVPSPGLVTIEKQGNILFNNLLYDRNLEMVFCSKETTYFYPNQENPQIIAKGDKAFFERENKTITITKNFKVDYIDPKKKENNFVVTSDKGLVEMEKNKATFIEDVRLVQKKFVLTSNQLDVSYKKGDKESGRALAYGNVKINDETFGRQAFSQQALYNQKTNEITLSGLPVVEQGKDKLAGEIIKINKESDYIEVINASANIRSQ